MSAQAEQMKVYVGELESLVGGSGNGVERIMKAALGSRLKITGRIVHREKAPLPERKMLTQTKGGTGKQRDLPPEQVIPFDEELRDF